VDAGIHFKLPFGIQEAIHVNVNEYFKEEIGYRTNPDGSTVRVANESKMITGDMNIVNVDFFVEYRISDPYKFLYHSESPEEILKNITQSRIRDVISSYNVDEVLTVSKAEIQAKIRELIMDELVVYDIGLSLTDIKIQDSNPPNDEVIAAFKSVETARQDRETSINEARAYENANIPRAESEADQILRNSEFVKQDRINGALRQVARFNAMFEEYALNPNIHRQRIYYEAIETVLPGVKLYVNTGNNDNISMILPLDEFASNNNE
jgi:membrane protease subunit HflK